MGFYRELEPGAIKAFSNDTMKFRNIIGTLNEPIQMDKPAEADAEKKDCDCNKNNDFCAINFKCKTKDCEESSWGCGVLDLQSCDGLAPGKIKWKCAPERGAFLSRYHQVCACGVLH